MIFIPTFIVVDWRTNEKLINYIIERNKDKSESELFRDINGPRDELKIIEVDDDEDINIQYGCYGAEYIIGHINTEQIIKDLMIMVNKKYTKDEINEYLNSDEVYKYTKKCFEIGNIDELCADEY